MDTAAELAAAVIEAAVERVFRSVTAVRDTVLASHRAARERGEPWRGRDVSAMGRQFVELLGRERDAVGLGVIVEPGVLPDRPLWLEWWQCEPDRDDPTRLEVDLNPRSVGFYDYAAAEWFVVPRRTGCRHVVGPYVDVHGTGRYLLTLTVPILADGEFLGVAGADVPVTGFEALVLERLGDPADAGADAVEIVIVNPEDRVVFSTSARRLTGSLVTKGRRGVRSLDLADPPWRVVVGPAELL
jgi:hypothetical protein